MKLSPTNYADLLVQLRTFWPDSLMVYSVILCLERSSSLEFNAWVDKWPNPEAIVVNADLEKCQNPLWKSSVFIFETNFSSLKELLIGKEKVTLDEERCLIFQGITSKTFQNITSILPKKKMKGNFYDRYWIQENDLLVERSIPNGFETGVLTRGIADLIQQHSPYKTDGFADDVYRSLTYNYPYEVVHDKATGAPVGWYTQSSIFGRLGNLLVVQKYRQRGLRKYMISSLTKKVLRRDGVPFVHVAQNNSLSIKIHKEMGFKLGGTYTYVLMIPDSIQEPEMLYI